LVLRLLRADGAPVGAQLLWAGGSPMVLYAFLNWDLVAIASLVAAVALHRRGADGWAGVVAGAGAAFKLFPALAVPVFAVARWRQGRRRDAVLHSAAAAGAWAVLNLPVVVVAPEGWVHFFRFTAERRLTAGSTWAVLSWLTGIGIEAANVLGFVLFVAGWFVSVTVGVRRMEATELWALVLPTFAWFLVTTKVYSPQFDLWLLALLVLARRHSLALPFMAVAVAVFVAEFSFLGGRIGFPPLAMAVTARMIVLLVVIVMATSGPETRVSATTRATSERRVQLWALRSRTRGD
jgi:uncharacterized membrane protein